MTIAFLDAYRSRFPVVAMCTVLEFSERTYYASRSRPPSARAGTDAVHKVTIMAEWTGNYSCYGPRRMYKHLLREGHHVARCTVARLAILVSVACSEAGSCTRPTPMTRRTGPRTW